MKENMAPKGDFDKNTDELFKRTNISWNKSKEEMWEQMESLIEEKPVIKLNQRKNEWVRYAVAAVILVLIGIPVTMRLYTKTVECPAGMHLTHQLPDGSSIHLNANSKLVYHPAWWRFSRTLRFEGEGFFEVQKGSTFSVNSVLGSTEVLGTSFNIFARSNSYKVTCVTGKVKVTANETSDQVLLSPNEQAQLNRNGNLDVKSEIEAKRSIGWVQNKFEYTEVFLEEVISEISRQYATVILFEADTAYIYTGYFSTDFSLEETLDLVCKPFSLNYVKNTEGGFTILAK